MLSLSRVIFVAKLKRFLICLLNVSFHLFLIESGYTCLILVVSRTLSVCQRNYLDFLIFNLFHLERDT